MQVQDLGTILMVWAHPDDETFCAGGLIKQATLNGQKVICVTATRGELGVQNEALWPADQLGDIRQQELAQALKILGVNEYVWLDCRDGGCQGVDKTPEIESLIDKYKPDTVLSFGADGLTGHPDHQAVSAWAAAAAKSKNIRCLQVANLDTVYEEMRDADRKFNYFFAVENPVLVKAEECDLVLSLTPELLEAKIEALRIMPSQYQTLFDGLEPSVINKMFQVEAFKSAAL